jgi:uncharacterized membrane protein YjgN (DUF898 family)
MNDQSHDFAVGAAASAFRFAGNWREYLPIALTNLLLTIVTLGIYRFWAKARERRYLWSRTEFIDDHLEWTGTGLEMFKGFVVVLLLVVPGLLFLQFGVQAMVIRGYALAAGLIGLGIYIWLLLLAGVARYRALRYRLTRTYWRGIRGGGDPGGWGYGWSYLWRTIVGSLALGLLIPWSMTRLWNERMQAMSFGDLRFEARADWRPIFPRFLAFYLIPFLLFLAGVAVVILSGLNLGPFTIYNQSPAFGLVMTLVIVLGTYLLTGLIALAYWSAYLRETISTTTLGNLQFEFEARTGDWIVLFVTNTLLVICTLGIGYPFVAYRNWAFYVRHMQAVGEIDVSLLGQSQTSADTDAEGLAAAFDIGAI